MTSPCDICTKCKNPKRCGNIGCMDWYQWFTAAWDAACGRMKKYPESQETPSEEEKDNGKEFSPA